ncbi:MAG: DUF4886 domain-containing protein [Alistipes sp.]|nr:DUF4886 domain-containing protein [Candidatus Alistipes equi]
MIAFTTILLSFFLFTSCTNSPITDISPIKTELSASFDITKSHFGEASENKIPILFDSTDELAVAGESTQVPLKFTTNQESLVEGGRSAKFYGAEIGDGPYVALFPYEYADKSSSKDQIVFNVPAIQSYSPTSFGITSNIAAATWKSGNSFTLQSLFGCIKISVKGTCSIAKVTIHDNIEESSLWGTVTAIPDASTGDITDISVSNSDSSKNMVTILLEGGIALSVDRATDFYFVLPEGALKKGMTMSLYDSNQNVVKVLSTTQDLSILRHTLHHMETITISDAILFSGGEGTQTNPYRIATVSDLNLLASYVNSGTKPFVDAFYSQTRNIDNATLKNHIGSYGSGGEHPFMGTYNGNGYTISNISFTSSTSETGQGLFGYTKDANILNVKVSGYTNTMTNKYSGVVVGCSTASTVTNCHVSGNITINGAQGGGVVGRNSTNSTVIDCSFSGSLSGTRNCLGGIVGLNAIGAQVKNCKVNATISAKESASGGVVGLCESDLKDAITSCEFNGEITSTIDNLGGILGKKANRHGGIVGCTTLGSVQGVSNVGGIVGAVDKNSDTAAPSVTIQQCVNGASIIATANNAGGIVGCMTLVQAGCKALIDKCANNADITALYNIGGIIGYASNKGDNIDVFNCVTSNCKLYATGADPSNHYARIGGIIGGTDSKSTSAVNSYNSCSININLQSDDKGASSTKRVSGIAGIVGSQYCAGSIVCCYSNVVDSNFQVPNGVIYYKGAIVGYNKGTLYTSDYYDSSCSYGAFYASNPCVGITKAQFTNGYLLEKLNDAASVLPGAATWIVDEKSGMPVPSGVKVDPVEPQNTIRILAIGNSFTEDAVEQYLYELFEEAGYNAIIGNAYIGGCSLEKHWANESSSVPSTKNSNSYRKIVQGIKSTSGSKSIEYILKDEPWDYVFFQQGDGKYGYVESHYPYLTNFLSYIAKFLKSGSYKTGYQLNWAFPKSCTNDRFALYDWDQDKMYRACAECAKELKSRSNLDLIIPTGTAIQNGRQTTLGDTFNRDWGHLEKNYGRFTAACTWFEQISGIDVRTLKYRPSTVSESTAEICRKIAHDAVLKPYDVTF